MAKRFNVTGACNPKINYMVNIDETLMRIKRMIDRGDYFTINRARQYGKTTTLGALEKMLEENYIVIHLDFQTVSSADFSSEHAFVAAFARSIIRVVRDDNRVASQVVEGLGGFADPALMKARLSELFPFLKNWCANSQYPLVLMIDEVDAASDNQVFLDFLAQLRAGFLARQLRDEATFLSVILAGVYDVKHLKDKVIRFSNEREKGFVLLGNGKSNSPWNIAADFKIDMSFDNDGIAGMLREYEEDYHTGMDIDEMAGWIEEYTSGYPYLVSRICNIMDEQLGSGTEYAKLSDVWTQNGFLEAVRIMLTEKNSLFDSLINKLQDYPELRIRIYELLFQGEKMIYNPDSESIGIAEMFGFVINKGGMAVIANRIFEIRLYNYFLSESEAERTPMSRAASGDKNQFVHHGKLDMELVLEKFANFFNELYGDKTEKFLEEEGRKYFLLFLRPIINGSGNYYIEAQTRDARRTDVIVDYGGEQFVIELKIWKGLAYNSRGEEQLADYLDYYHLKKGYMVSFSFNKNKRPGVRKVHIGDKVLIEAVV